MPMLSVKAGRKLQDMLRADEEQPKLPPLQARERAENYLQITSTTQTSGRYPATLYRYNNDNSFTAVSAAGALWLRAANNTQLQTGVYYHATGRALNAADGVLIYVTDDACCGAGFTTEPIQSVTLTADTNVTPTSGAIDITANASGWIATLVDIPGIGSGFSVPVTITNTDASDSFVISSTNTNNLTGNLTVPAGASVDATYDGTTGKYTINSLSSASLGGTSAGGVTIIKVSKIYSDFSTAGVSNTITLRALATTEVLMGVVMKATTTFGGGGIVSYTIEVGNSSGSTTRYLQAKDVFTAVATYNSGSGGSQSTSILPENYQASNNINATARSVGANLNAATQGAVDFYIIIGTLP